MIYKENNANNKTLEQEDDFQTQFMTVNNQMKKNMNMIHSNVQCKQNHFTLFDLKEH